MTTNAPSKQLFSNVDVFDGVNEQLVKNANVLVEGNVVKTISTKPIEPGKATVFDGTGMTLMPGIVEAHGHLTLAGCSIPDLLSLLPSYAAIMGVKQAEQALMNGVTTLRDMGGEVFSLKIAIDAGEVLGPRLYPSGAMISQTGGHADFRSPVQLNPHLGGPTPQSDINRYSVLVDGPALMMSAAREQLRLGATQVKLCIGGGVSSPADPIDVTEFTTAEIAAAVEVAENFGTYVAVHGYTVRAVNQALDAGVKSVEHGHLLDEKTLMRIAEEGVWLSFQPFTESHEANLDAAQNAKQAIVSKGTTFVYEMIKQMPELKVAHGTDTFMNPPNGNRDDVTQMERLLPWFTPFEILRMATSRAAELLAMCGPRNPYPLEFGVVKEGAYADLLLVGGNPLQDITKVTNRDNLRIIMKDGVVHKNTL